MTQRRAHAGWHCTGRRCLAAGSAGVLQRGGGGSCPAVPSSLTAPPPPSCTATPLRSTSPQCECAPCHSQCGWCELCSEPAAADAPPGACVAGLAGLAAGSVAMPAAQQDAASGGASGLVAVCRSLMTEDPVLASCSEVCWGVGDFGAAACSLCCGAQLRPRRALPATVLQAVNADGMVEHIKQLMVVVRAAARGAALACATDRRARPCPPARVQQPPLTARPACCITPAPRPLPPAVRCRAQLRTSCMPRWTATLPTSPLTCARSTGWP